MTVRLFRDIEEALAREVRRITFHDDRSLSHTVLKDVFDPITGEAVAIPIEPDFYDSSADTKNIQYPHFFIKLLKSREDRFSGRVIPQYGRICSTPVLTSPKAYEIVLYGTDGVISAAGNSISTSMFQIKKAQINHLLRILSGPNQGTYKITAVTANVPAPHSITVSNDLLTALPLSAFNSTSRVLTFTDLIDLNTIKVGDNFIDSLSVSWPISAISIADNSITLGGVGTPNTAINSKINRPGNVFGIDAGPIKFSVMDPTKPVVKPNGNVYASNLESNYPVPIDAYYLIRIDSKEKTSHVDVATRMWEEFNPPRTGLPVIIRTAASNEQPLLTDVTIGGNTTIQVTSNSNYKVGETVFIFDDFTPTKAENGDGFQEIFSAKILNKTGTNSLVLSATVPDTFKVQNNTKIVSNARAELYMFHFVDHITRDVEGAQYWSHEFTFWVQAWMDRQGEAAEYTAVQEIATSGEDLEGNVIIEC